MANFYSDEEFSVTDISEMSFNEEEILVIDEISDNEPLGIECLENLMFNLLLNIYN